MILNLDLSRNLASYSVIILFASLHKCQPTSQTEMSLPQICQTLSDPARAHALPSVNTAAMRRKCPQVS